MAAIVVTDLAKAYGEVQAVRDVSLELAEGEVLALLGPNGAGKTTTVEILEGYRSRDGGHVEVLGTDPEHGGRRLRERLGIVLQEAGIYPELSVEEAIRLHAGYYPHPRPVGEVIELAGLVDKRRARIKSLSGGQKRRLDLALGIVGDPEVLFLDEPTTGFDPSARRQAWDVVAGLGSLGTTILLTTHYMDEAQRLADRVAVIADGAVVATGTPDELGGRDRGEALVQFRDMDGITDRLPPDLGAEVTRDEGRITIRTVDVTRVLWRLTGWALGSGVELAGLTVARPSLEDTYLALVDSQHNGHPPRGEVRK